MILMQFYIFYAWRLKRLTGVKEVGPCYSSVQIALQLPKIQDSLSYRELAVRRQRGRTGDGEVSPAV